jgi:hypothetical protein
MTVGRILLYSGVLLFLAGFAIFLLSDVAVIKFLGICSSMFIAPVLWMIAFFTRKRRIGQNTSND